MIDNPTTPIAPVEPHRRWPKRLAWGLAFAATLGIGVAIGSAGQHTVTKTVASPPVYVKVDVPGPVTIKTVTKMVKVPGPTVYKTQYVPASQGPTGTVIAKYSGTGNQNTGQFDLPSSGNIVVSWSYWNNSDCSFGTCQATNFAMSNSGGGFGDLPNDIATSGSGSTEITNESNSTESFNVQAVGGWSITVKSAP